MDCKKLKDVLVIQTDEMAYKPERYPEFQGQHLTNVSIVSVDYDLPSLIENHISFYPVSCTPSVGDTYVKSPFEDNVFIEISTFEDYVRRQQYTCMCDIARKLGAKQMHASYKVECVESRSWDAKLGVQYNGVEVEGEVKHRVDNIEKSQDEHFNEAVGKKITLDDWKNAEAQAEKYNLMAEPDVKDMLKALHPVGNGGNHDTIKKVRTSMSSEVNKKLDIAFNVNACAGLFKLNAGFQQATEYRYKTEVMYEFIFPE